MENLKYFGYGAAVMLPVLLFGFILPPWAFTYCMARGHDPQTSYLIGSIPFLFIMFVYASASIGYALKELKNA